MKHCLVFSLILIFLALPAAAVSQEGDELLPIEENDLWGFVDKQGNVVIKPQFLIVDNFSEGLALVQLETGKPSKPGNSRVEISPAKLGFIDKTGKVVLEVWANDLRSFDRGMAAIRLGDYNDGKYFVAGKYGFIDKTGKLIVQPQFDFVSLFSEGLAAVKIYNHWGFINEKGEIVIPPLFEWVEDFSEGLAAAEKGKKWGFIDQMGNFVIEPQFSAAGKFSEGLASVIDKNDRRWGFIDRMGRMVIKPKYESAGVFVDGKTFITESRNGIYKDRYCINKKGEEMPPEQCAGEFPISKIIDGKKVFVDEAGRVVFENKWEGVVGFRNGVAFVYNPHKTRRWSCGLFVPGWKLVYDACYNWGYIDKTGKYIWKQPELD